ncbi:MAG: hypothetical protein H0X14_05935 [Acidobacteria bacterium]|nr:hypothetical protein [Acidobacteriota bacterium]
MELNFREEFTNEHSNLTVSVNVRDLRSIWLTGDRRGAKASAPVSGFIEAYGEFII